TTCRDRFSITLTLSVFVEEFYYLAVSTRRDLCVGLASETVNAFGNCNELMLDAFGAEFLIHLDRERVWHIRVFGAMDKQSRWIVPRHVAYRTKGVECARLGIRIVTSQHLGPKSLLAAIQVELTAARFVGFFL